LLWTKTTEAMNNFTAPLKAAGIPIYAVSTQVVSPREDDSQLPTVVHDNTDLVLVSSEIQGQTGRGALKAEALMGGILQWLRSRGFVWV
jgi:hypothetical protein